MDIELVNPAVRTAVLQKTPDQRREGASEGPARAGCEQSGASRTGVVRWFSGEVVCGGFGLERVQPGYSGGTEADLAGRVEVGGERLVSQGLQHLLAIMAEGVEGGLEYRAELPARE